MSRYMLIVALLIAAFAVGFFQEYVKVNINYIVETGDRLPGFFEQDASVKKQWLNEVQVDAPYDYYYNHGKFEALYGFSRSGLTTLKWIMTVFFVIVFLGINLLLLHLLTQQRTVLKWTMLLYLVFFVLSFGIYLFGKLTGTFEQAYAVSRRIVGALQSLVPLMLVLPAVWLMRTKMEIHK